MTSSTDRKESCRFFPTHQDGEQQTSVLGDTTMGSWIGSITPLPKIKIKCDNFGGSGGYKHGAPIVCFLTHVANRKRTLKCQQPQDPCHIWYICQHETHKEISQMYVGNYTSPMGSYGETTTTTKNTTEPLKVKQFQLGIAVLKKHFFVREWLAEADIWN